MPTPLLIEPGGRIVAAFTGLTSLIAFQAGGAVADVVGAEPSLIPGAVQVVLAILGALGAKGLLQKVWERYAKRADERDAAERRTLDELRADRARLLAYSNRLFGEARAHGLAVDPPPPLSTDGAVIAPPTVLAP